MTESIKWKELLPAAITPTRGSEGSAGFDLYAYEPATLWPGCRLLVSTGIACAIPAGWVGIINPRSGLACKGITVDAGVIDSDYRGEIKVLLVHHEGSAYSINMGDRIAQMVVVPYLAESEVVDELPDTDRGDGGFGSTGMR